MAIYSLVDENDLRTMKDIDRFIREKECIALTTLANSTRWKMEQANSRDVSRSVNVLQGIDFQRFRHGSVVSGILDGNLEKQNSNNQ